MSFVKITIKWLYTVVKEFKFFTKKWLRIVYFKTYLIKCKLFKNYYQSQKLFALRIPGGLSVLLDKTFKKIPIFYWGIPFIQLISEVFKQPTWKSLKFHLTKKFWVQKYFISMPDWCFTKSYKFRNIG